MTTGLCAIMSVMRTMNQCTEYEGDEVTVSEESDSQAGCQWK